MLKLIFAVSMAPFTFGTSLLLLAVPSRKSRG